MRLAIAALQAAGLARIHLDLGNPTIYRALTEGSGLGAEDSEALFHAVAQKDAPGARELAAALPADRAAAIVELTNLNGTTAVIGRARERLPRLPAIATALDALDRLAAACAAPGVEVSVDLAELGGFNYESGLAFAAFVPASPDAVARGGRYDEVGASFGRARPATGFTMDLRQLAALAPAPERRGAILAPCAADAALEAAVAKLRASGEIVVADLPGHREAAGELACDRALVRSGTAWTVVPLKGE